MATKIEQFIKPFLKQDLPDIRPGDTVRVHQKIPARNASLARNASRSDASGHSDAGGKEGKNEKTQTFEGIVIAKKHGKGISATITVRKEISGVGVERIFPLHLPTIEKIEVLRRGKVRRAKLYYLREKIGKEAKLKSNEKIK